MTVTTGELLLYASGLFILFITPGPVWVAVIARALAYGMRGVWPLGLGVALGDVLWPLVAIFGVSALVSVYADFLILLRWAAVVILVVMGLSLIRFASKDITAATGLGRPGVWAGFSAGLLAVIANPKASLFYMGFLPGFFDFSQINGWDVLAICLTSFIVPLLGNLTLGLFVERIRRFLASPQAVRRTNIGAGVALIGVGVVIALT
ncbi:MAG: LysE family translocator [Paracoccaceae bacterium]